MAKINIGGRLHSTATGNVVTGADEVLYEPTGGGTPKKQSEVNVETYEHVANIDAALQELSPDQTEALALATDVNDLKANVVRSDAQTLTDAQKAQALANVGISGIDDEPTAGSNNLVKSGGIQNELALGAVYDVSAKNPTAGPNNDGKFISLSALLSDANLNTIIPPAVRKGGMSIKFVQSSDNKYVQYRLMSPTWSTVVTDWQGVDAMPTPGSKNFVESGGALSIISDLSEKIDGKILDMEYYQGNIGSNGKFQSVSTRVTTTIPVTSNFTYKCKSGFLVISIIRYKNGYSPINGGTLDTDFIRQEIGGAARSEYNVEIDSNFPNIYITIRKTESSDAVTTDEARNNVDLIYPNSIEDIVVKKADISDNLTTDDSSKVLSARQGKILKDELTTVESGLDNTLQSRVIPLGRNIKIEKTLSNTTDVAFMEQDWESRILIKLVANETSTNVKVQVRRTDNSTITYNLSDNPHFFVPEGLPVNRLYFFTSESTSGYVVIQILTNSNIDLYNRDTKPTINSKNIVESGGVKDEIDSIGTKTLKTISGTEYYQGGVSNNGTKSVATSRVGTEIFKQYTSIKVECSGDVAFAYARKYVSNVYNDSSSGITVSNNLVPFDSTYPYVVIVFKRKSNSSADITPEEVAANVVLKRPDSLENRIDTLDNTTDSLDGRVDILEPKVTSLKRAVFLLNDDVKELNKTVYGEVETQTGSIDITSGLYLDVFVPNINLEANKTYKMTIAGDGTSSTTLYFYLYESDNRVNFRNSEYPSDLDNHQEYDKVGLTVEPKTWYIKPSSVVNRVRIYSLGTAINDTGSIDLSFEEYGIVGLVEKTENIEDSVQGVETQVSALLKTYNTADKIINLGTVLFDTTHSIKAIWLDSPISFDENTFITLHTNRVDSIDESIVLSAIYDSGGGLTTQLFPDVLPGGETVIQVPSNGRKFLYGFSFRNPNLREYSFTASLELTAISNSIKFFDEPEKRANYVPQYYFQNSYLDNRLAVIDKYLRGNILSGDAFYFVTDTHWEFNRKRSPAIIRELNKKLNIPKVFHGGDVYHQSINLTSDCINSYREAVGSNRVYPCWGNHEFINGEKYSDVFVNTSMYLENAVYGGSNKQYYYVDNNVAKIRYIILYVYGEKVGGSYTSGYNDTVQLNWLSSVALNVENGWDIMILTHYIGSPSASTNEYTYPSGFSDVANIINNYDGNGRIVAVITGHTHRDFVLLESLNVPIIITTCDHNMDFAFGGVKDFDNLQTPRDSGTVNEQAFDAVVYDRSNCLLHFIRIGSEADNKMNRLTSNVQVACRSVYCTHKSVNDSIVLPTYLTGSVSWESSDTSVATVSEGIVSCVSDGCVRVTATGSNGEKQSFYIKIE